MFKHSHLTVIITVRTIAVVMRDKTTRTSLSGRDSLRRTQTHLSLLRRPIQTTPEKVLVRSRASKRRKLTLETSTALTAADGVHLRRWRGSGQYARPPLFVPAPLERVAKPNIVVRRFPGMSTRLGMTPNCLPHFCTNFRSSAKYQAAHSQVRNNPDQKVPEEMGTDR